MNDLIYMKEHLKFLMDQLVEAYHSQSFEEYDKLKKQISNLKEVMNSRDRITSTAQILEKHEDSILS